MKAITFNLRLLEPVLATQVESGEENSSTSFGFIPGSMVRGALIRRYFKGRPPRFAGAQEMPAADEARRLFLDGSVCFLNAYPLHPGHPKHPEHPEPPERMLPRPLSWLVKKDEERASTAQVYDFAVHADETLKNSKNPSGEFCRRDGGTVELRSAAVQVNVHNASDDPNSKAAGSSTVYRYQALAADEVLAAAIISADPDALKRLAPLLTGELMLGGSHTAGYGRAAITDVVLPEDSKEWSEYTADPAEGSDIIITLLSDAIVRSADGQSNGDLDAALAALGMPAKHAKAFARYRLVSGYNRQAGLPLPQEWALQAGSVFVYPRAGLDVAQLKGIVERGIGERRAEGFGRIAVNWFTRPTLTRQPLTRRQDTAEPIPLSGASAELAKEMAQRRLRALLERQLVQAVNAAEWSPAVPQNAQLSRVRAAAQQALLTHSLVQVTDLLDGLKGARTQFERARISGEPLIDWLRARVELTDISAQLKLGKELPRVAGQTAELAPSLRVEFTARLIDGVMNKALKRREDNPPDATRRSS